MFYLKNVRVISKEKIKTKQVLPSFLVKSLKKRYIKRLSPPQSSVIPVIFDLIKTSNITQRDLIVESPTGSGKTFCYILPLMKFLNTFIRRDLRVLIIIPTRELALQVYAVFQKYKKKREKLRVCLSISSKNFTEKKINLDKQFNTKNKKATEILICLPGKIIDHLGKNSGFTLLNLNFIIIDEVDRLIKQSFIYWLQKLQEQTKHLFWYGKHRIKDFNKITKSPNFKLLFSATIPRNIREFEKLKLYSPIVFRSNIETKFSLPRTLENFKIKINLKQKPLYLSCLLEAAKINFCLIFTISLYSTQRLSLFLKLSGFSVGEYSSILTNKQKKKDS